MGPLPAGSARDRGADGLMARPQRPPRGARPRPTATSLPVRAHAQRPRPERRWPRGFWGTRSWLLHDEAEAYVSAMSGTPVPRGELLWYTYKRALSPCLFLPRVVCRPVQPDDTLGAPAVLTGMHELLYASWVRERLLLYFYPSEVRRRPLPRAVSRQRGIPRSGATMGTVICSGERRHHLAVTGES